MTSSQYESAIAELHDLAAQIKSAVEPKRTELVQVYLHQLDNLLQMKWDYALGKDGEIDESLLPARYISQRNQVIEDLQIKLGRCAERYRAAIPNSPSDKKALADYYQTYDELIRVNGGIIALDPDSELPDDLMPQAYVDYWLHG